MPLARSSRGKEARSAPFDSLAYRSLLVSLLAYMSQERPAETSKGKVKAKAKAKAASTSQGNPGDASVELKLPTFIPPEGALKSRAPGRKSVACR